MVIAICEAIHENAAYLSEIDGATGDGDHGVNMNKGFLLAKERLSCDMSFSEAIQIVGRTLVMDIGGSMGPIYGTMFSKMSKLLKKEDTIDARMLLTALESAVEGLKELAGANIGDKTLLDTLYPACVAMRQAIEEESDFTMCLHALKEGAQAGKENTKNLIAKVGRAARLGERSRGFLDAGATSCCIILVTMANAIQDSIHKG